jgi:hypothetical protein
MRTISIVVVLMALLVGGSSTALRAQTSTGAVTGVVTDAQHLALPDADVTIQSLQTGSQIKIKTNSAGVFSVPALQPGQYKVTANKAGFEQAVLGVVSVNIAGIAEADLALKVGSVTAQVDVTATGQLLTVDAPTLSTVIDQKVTQDLPYPERSALEVATLAPGVVGDPQYANGVQSESPAPFTQQVTPGFFGIGGGRAGTSAELVDGLDITIVSYPRAGITFSNDSIAQVTVQENGLGAEYGRNGGGLVNQASKAGTNQYHGVLAYRHYDSFLGAYTWGSPFGPNNKQNLFTATLGGPVPVPGLHKNTFFFGSFEPLRADVVSYARGRVPSDLENTGVYTTCAGGPCSNPAPAACSTYNVTTNSGGCPGVYTNIASSLLNSSALKAWGYAAALAAGPQGGIYNHYTGSNAQGYPQGTQYTSPSSYVPYAGNNLSAQLAGNTLAKTVIGYEPSFEHPGPFLTFLYGASETYGSDGSNATVVRAVNQTDNRYDVRVDHVFPNADSVFVRYTRTPVGGLRYNYLGPNSPINTVPTETVLSQNAVVDYVHVFKNGSKVNEVRANYLRFDDEILPPASALTKDYGAALGLIPAVMGKGFPALSLDGLSAGSGGATGKSLNQIFSYGDDFSFLVGRHSLKIGGEWRSLQLDRVDDTSLYGGNYGFSSGTTNNGSAGGNGTASFILGEINSFTIRRPQPFYYRWKYMAGYIQDNWKATSKLTVNLGMRYNLELPRKEKNNLQGTFLPGLTGSLNGVAATGGFQFAGAGGLQHGLWPTNYKGFEPRLGFAYQPTKFMTVRASYSLIHIALTGTSDSTYPDLQPAALQFGGVTGGTIPNQLVSYITNPINLPATLPGVSTSGPLFTYLSSGYLAAINQSDAVPYTQLWSASLQFQVSRSAVVEFTYAGQKGTHLFNEPIQLNTPSLPSILGAISNHTNLSPSNVANVYGLTTTETGAQALNPYQQFYNNPIYTAFDRNASSNYNAVYISGNERVKGGLTFQGSLVWSKSMDNDSSDTLGDGITGEFGEAQSQSPYDQNGVASGVPEYSLSTFDIPLRVSGGFVWDIPVGRGKALNISNRVVDFVVGGWQTSGIFSSEAGYPIWVALSGPGYFISNTPATGTAGIKYGGNGTPINTARGGFVLRPNIVPGVPLIKPNWHHDPFGTTAAGGYLNPAAFAVPGSPDHPAFGNASRTLGAARNPVTTYYDMSVRKTFPVAPRGRVDFTLKIDAINVLNHPNFLFNPNSGHTYTNGINSTTGVYNVSSTFGDLNGATNGRTVAFGGTLRF